MKQHINGILLLMSVCVLGIIGLQLFWNYQNYQSTVDRFRRDSNESLREAVDLEKEERRQEVIDQTKRWLADTSFIQITCDTDNHDSVTQFHINDRYPKFAGSKGLSFSVETFKPRLKQITPEAKAFVISHFTDNTLRSDLQKGFIYYYTQRLGDSIHVVFSGKRARLNRLDTLYRTILRTKGIQTSFVLNPTGRDHQAYLTEPVNTSLRGPFFKQFVRAGFESPDTYFLKTMKWVILSTLGLIAVCLVCFGYTAKTLLSQYKLARLKDDFINNMTHELNTPLASLKITAEALRTFTHDPQRQAEYVQIIEHQTEKLTDLTARILDTNRHMHLPQQPKQPVSLSTLITGAIADMATQLTATQAVIDYAPPSCSMQILGDETQLKTVFTNLIDNALKYALPNPALTIGLTTQTGWAEVIVADTGRGIPIQYRETIFEPFFRVPQGNLHDVKGYGLGLSYVRQVVREHGGTIRVEANEPRGSRFIIRLPVA